MLQSSAPAKIPLPFATSGTKNTIPETTAGISTPGQASMDVGFPALTFTPLNAGGIPPQGADFNGILFTLAAIARWVNAGGTFVYDSTFATDSNVNGYPKGAVLSNAAGTGLWFNTSDNNTSNPDTGGAGWIPLNTGRLLNVQIFTTSGTYTPTAGTTSIEVEVLGGGGGGGGVVAMGASQSGASTGGAAGAWAKKRIASGVTSQTVTIGSGGTAGSTAGSNGGNGGTSSFGAIVSCTGGAGGAGISAAATGTYLGGVVGGTPSGGDVQTVGGCSAPAWASSSAGFFSQGSASNGANSPYGSGGPAALNNINPSLGAAYGYGAGGGGVQIGASTAARAGGVGAPGIVIVREYA